MSLVCYMPLDSVDASDVYLGIHSDTRAAGLRVVALEYVSAAAARGSVVYAVEQVCTHNHCSSPTPQRTPLSVEQQVCTQSHCSYAAARTQVVRVSRGQQK